MLRLNLFVASLAAGLCLVACSPSMNWREVRPAGSRLRALMPCKPDEAVRSVPLDGRQAEMHLAGCDAGGATFVIGWISVPVERLGAALGDWQDATLSRAGIAAGPDAPAGRAFVPSGGLSLPQAVRLQATGRSPDGQALPLDAAWFASADAAGAGSTAQAFFAAIYGTPASPDATDDFFSNLQPRRSGGPPP